MRFAFLRSFSAENFKATALRFPLSLLSGAVASACALWMSYHEYDGFTQDVTRLWVSSFVGILLFTGLALFAERHRLRSWLIQLMGIPMLYLLIYRFDFDHDLLTTVRVGLVFLSSLALIFSGPYLFLREEKGFWLFFVRVWNRAMFAVATSLIVFAALNLALVSIENLFELSLDSRWYQYVPSIFLVFVPNLVFLMGIPSDYKTLEKEAHSVSFRALATYLFAPLLSVYFLILATYVAKILVTQVWPNGFVAMPIVIFSVIGFGMYALIFPLLQDKDTRLLKFFSKLLLWSLPVFMAVYFAAFWLRMDQYGVTEMRYLGVALGVLISAWSLYFGWAKKPQLKFIPIGLFVVPLVLSFGPWGVFQVSEMNQVARLKSTLESQGLLKDGFLVPSTNEAMGLEVRQEISSDLDYLVYNHGEESVADIFLPGDNMSVDALMAQLGLSYASPYDSGADTGMNYYFTVNDSDAEDVLGYHYLVHYYFYDSAPLGGDTASDPNFNDLTYTFDKKTLTFHYNHDANAIEVSGAGATLSIPLQDFMAGLEQNHPEQSPLSKDTLSISAENKSLAVKIYFNTLSYYKIGEEFNSLSTDSTVLIRLK